jgi:glycosyltransferase involved in cell wall biosynthesis
MIPKKQLRVLILCPHLQEKGGVANYYGLVKKNFSSREVLISFHFVGSKENEKSVFNRIITFINGVTKFRASICTQDLIVLNPSLDIKSLVRDGTYHFIAKFLHKKRTIIFFRGWDVELEKIIDSYFRKVFIWLFNSDKIIVLSNIFKNKLVSWGFEKNRIIVETTTFEDVNYEECKSIYNIVFLSRFSKAKGGLEAIMTVELLLPEFPHLKLFMVGDGDEAYTWKKYILEKGISENVEFTGWLTGESKKNILEKCGIMLYPTYYGEGLPNSLLEGMGYGQVIITRPVAGIPEVIQDKVNGFLIESLDPADFANIISCLIKDRDLWEEISQRNRVVALQQFEISSVTKRLEKIYLEFQR